MPIAEVGVKRRADGNCASSVWLTEMWSKTLSWLPRMVQQRLQAPAFGHYLVTVIAPRCERLTA